jgi:hypothetical protein
VKTELIQRGGLDSYRWDDWIIIQILMREAETTLSAGTVSAQTAAELSKEFGWQQEPQDLTH